MTYFETVFNYLFCGTFSNHSQLPSQPNCVTSELQTKLIVCWDVCFLKVLLNNSFLRTKNETKRQKEFQLTYHNYSLTRIISIETETVEFKGLIRLLFPSSKQHSERQCYSNIHESVTAVAGCVSPIDWTNPFIKRESFNP